MKTPKTRREMMDEPLGMDATARAKKLAYDYATLARTARRNAAHGGPTDAPAPEHPDVKAIRQWPRDPWPAPIGARREDIEIADELQAYRALVLDAMLKIKGGYVDPFGNDYGPDQVTTPGDPITRVKGLGILVAAYVPHTVDLEVGPTQPKEYCYMTYSTRRSAMLAAAAHAEAYGWEDGRYPFEIMGNADGPAPQFLRLMAIANPGSVRYGLRADRARELQGAREVAWPHFPSMDAVTTTDPAEVLREDILRQKDFEMDHMIGQEDE